MPTTKQRTQVTHTPEVQQALAIGAKFWPEDANHSAALLTKLSITGANHLAEMQIKRQEAARAKILAAAGSFPGLYQPGYLEEIRAGWSDE